MRADVAFYTYAILLTPLRSRGDAAKQARRAAFRAPASAAAYAASKFAR